MIQRWKDIGHTGVRGVAFFRARLWWILEVPMKKVWPRDQSGKSRS